MKSENTEDKALVEALKNLPDEQEDRYMAELALLELMPVQKETI